MHRNLAIPSSSVIQVRSRRVRPGPEAQLLRTVLKTEFLIGRSLPAVFFHEPQLPTGLPDLVAVYLSNGKLEVNRHRLKLRQSHVRLLHFLYVARKASAESISEQLRIPAKQLSVLLRDLRQAHLITDNGTDVRPRSLSRVFGVKYIIAIEAKVSNWSRALVQAVGNYWFASHSYILIPRTKVLPKVIARAEELGVGVLVLDGSSISVTLEPRKRKLPGSYGSWLLNEWALRRRRLLNERK